MVPFKFFSGCLNSINISMESVNVHGNVRRLRATFSPELIEDLNGYHDIDVEDQLIALMSEQIAAEVDREIIQHIHGNNFILPIAQRLSARTLGNDLISVQPLSVPSGMLFYIDIKKSLKDFKFFIGW